MKLSHKQKVQLAKKLITPIELKEKVSIWSSKNWTKRSEAIRQRGKPVASIISIKKVVKMSLWDRIKSFIHRYLTATAKRV